MNLAFAEYPRYVSPKEYRECRDRMVEKLIRLPGVVSIYQIGGGHTPGVSDIDLLVVFEDDVSCDFNPLQGLARHDRYLFVHELYGVARRSLALLRSYCYLHNPSLLYGRDGLEDESHAPEDSAILRRQQAWEYLIKQYISLSIERAYGLVRVRNLLLHTKAVKYDLDLLSNPPMNLQLLVERLIKWRSKWFSTPPAELMLQRWVDSFYAALESFISSTLPKQGFYLPSSPPIQLARNILIWRSGKLFRNHSGIAFPSLWARCGKRFFNFQHRFNRFDFGIPYTCSTSFAVLKKRNQFLSQLFYYNRQNLRFFPPVPVALNIFQGRDSHSNQQP